MLQVSENYRSDNLIVAAAAPPAERAKQTLATHTHTLTSLVEQLTDVEQARGSCRRHDQVRVELRRGANG